LLDHFVWNSILLPTLPLEREIGPTVVDICLDWIEGLILLLWTRRVGLGKLGGGLRNFLGDGPKFFNRSPITLKFGGSKLERESQERERESESESESGASCYFYACKLSFYTRKLAFYTRKFLLFLLVSCDFTLVSC